MIVVDTNVLSELMRMRPDPAVLRWFGRQSHSELFTSSVSQAEVFYGLCLLPLGKRREKLLAEAEKMFNVDFADRVLPFEGGSALRFATIAAERRSMGRPMGYPDAQIAAVTLTHRASLATRNRSDFENCGIELIDPWKAER
jgi:toxin FitB